MNKVAIGVGTAIVVVPYTWLVAASALYLAFAQRMDLFVFPYVQWLEYAPWWHYSKLITAMVVGSGAIPTVVLALLFVAFLRGSKKNS